MKWPLDFYLLRSPIFTIVYNCLNFLSMLYKIDLPFTSHFETSPWRDVVTPRRHVTVTWRNVTHKKHFFFLFSSLSIFIITCSLRVGSETVGKPIYEAVLEHFNELKTVKNCSKNAKNILNDVTSRRISKRHRYVASPSRYTSRDVWKVYSYYLRRKKCMPRFKNCIWNTLYLIDAWNQEKHPWTINSIFSSFSKPKNDSPFIFSNNFYTHPYGQRKSQNNQKYGKNLQQSCTTFVWTWSRFVIIWFNFWQIYIFCLDTTDAIWHDKNR